MRTHRIRARRSEPVHTNTTLVDPDYRDAFTIDNTAPSRRAEEWAHATFEGAPSLLRGTLPTAWRYGLGFKLGPRSSTEHVFGWHIASATPHLAVLEMSSFLGPAQLVFQVDEARVVAATLIRFERRGARALWTLAGLIHRRVLPYLLSHAARTQG